MNARGNQSSYNIDVKFCGWKSRYKIYTIKLLDSVSQENGMYKVPFVLNMRSFLIKNFINLFIHKSIRPSDLSISCFPYSSVYLFIYLLLLFFWLTPRLFKSINHLSGLWWVLLIGPFYIGDLQEGENLRKELLYLCFWKNIYIAFNFLGRKLILASWYACIDYVTFHRETPLRRTVYIPTIDMKRTLLCL